MDEFSDTKPDEELFKLLVVTFTEVPVNVHVKFVCVCIRETGA